MFIKHYLNTCKTIIKNRPIFLTMVLSVVFYSFFYPFAYQAQRPDGLPIVIVDQEQSPLSQTIITTASHVPDIKVIAVETDFIQAKHMVQAGRAEGILLLPDSLSQSIHHGQTGGIGLYLSSAYFLRTQTIAAGLSRTIQETIAQEMDKFLHTTHKPMPQLIRQVPLFNPLSGYGSYIFPAVAPLIVHQTILLGLCMLVAGYREQKWQATPSEFLAIYAVGLTIGCLSCFYLFGFAFWWHDYPRGGNFWGMVLAVPIFVSCAIGVSLLLASFLDSSERAGLVLIFSSIGLFMLTGLAFPIIGMPTLLQYIANILPTTHGVQLFVQLNQMGVPTTDIVTKLLYLSVVAIGCLILAFLRLKKPKH